MPGFSLNSGALSCGRCFGAGTKVATDEGPKNIEDIQVGDRVLSKNDVTGDLDYKEVEELFTRTAPDVYVITIGNETLTTTAEHPFYIHNVGWVRTQDLHIGDKMETSSGTTAAVEKIEQVDEPTKVYNFSVADYHTYFVSDLQVWTHNSSRDCGIEGTGNAKPYSNSRPSYGKGQVNEVWDNAKDVDGKVYDPNTGEELAWDKSKSRAGQLDMGHTPENKCCGRC
ncbi:polymorphic toxin-type HINT domain-containing protein [Tumebacillus sp. DT12]|uniref:Polymorphic toxin-type HINT domain-containing protein n=1 Tax=Tumebacillus lacus TaxID=2995335 RepID=A0ABT3X671_9BACL|nr:polymorphic toxin-type HINT domain-containing protein [Tumebacillus lacus]